MSSPEKRPREQIKIQHILHRLGGFSDFKKHRSDDNFLILRSLRMVFKGVVGVKNVRTLKNVSKDYLHEVKKGDAKNFPPSTRRCFLCEGFI